MITITLYKYTGIRNKLNKELTDSLTINGLLRKSSELKSPFVLIEGAYDDYSEYNYCIISELHRAYFVNKYTLIGNNMIKLELECDLLFTMKDTLKASCTATLEAYSGGDKNSNDYPLHYNLAPTIAQVKFPDTPFTKDGNIIMITARG